MNSKQYIDILNIEKAPCNCSSEWHEVCSNVLQENNVVKLHRLQISINGKEKVLLLCVGIDGIEYYYGGFLFKSHAKKADYFHVNLYIIMSFLKKIAIHMKRRGSKMQMYCTYFCYPFYCLLWVAGFVIAWLHYQYSKYWYA